MAMPLHKEMAVNLATSQPIFSFVGGDLQEQTETV